MSVMRAQIPQHSEYFSSDLFFAKIKSFSHYFLIRRKTFSILIIFKFPICNEHFRDVLLILKYASTIYLQC